MKITKLGHCCLVLEQNEIKIVTDPGYFTVDAVKELQGISTILITHEHGDHFHVESIEGLLKNNPTATVVSNASVAKLLAEKNIPCTIVGDGQSATVNNLLIEGFGKDHAPIYETYGLVENTGYFVENKFYFPGDNFWDPGKAIDVLALPTAGPWMKLSEAVDFAKKVKPRIAFSVHDAILVPGFTGFVAERMQKFLKEDGIEFVALGVGESKEF